MRLLLLLLLTFDIFLLFHLLLFSRMGSTTAYSRYGPVISPWSSQPQPAPGAEAGSTSAADTDTSTDMGVVDAGTVNTGAGAGSSSYDVMMSTALSAGGSSGGGAAAVACGATFGALASDTGGSVRQVRVVRM